MPRSPSKNGRPQRPRSLSASQGLRRQLQASPHVESEARGLFKDLESVAAELAEVKEVLRHGGSFLGLSGTLLQEYFIELAKKDNLLRLALSRTSANATSMQATKRRSNTFDETTLRSVSSDSPPAAASEISMQSLSVLERSRQMPSSVLPEASATTLSSVEVDWSNLAAVITFLEAFPDDACAQRLGIKAVGRLARDAGQLRPLCLAATLAVTHCIFSFHSNLGLSRMSVTALGNICYLPDIAAVIAHEALPALFLAMVTHTSDQKLQAVACEALARMFQASDIQVVTAIVQTMLGHFDPGALHVCCEALVRLHDCGICAASHVLNVLVPMTESQPTLLDLQQRAAIATQMLVRSGAISETEVKNRAPSLLSGQWLQLLRRFLGSDRDEADQTARFHAEVQTVFHEEVVKHFEYEAAERSLHMLQSDAPGSRRVQEVIRCLVENLEDYQVRLEARELAWDPDAQRLVPLDLQLRDDLCSQALASMETGLIESLQAVAPADCSQGEEVLVQRTSRLRNECAALLERKTEATQVHQERTTELRREVMVFEAVEHLEVRANIDLSATQVRSAMHMLEIVETVAPVEAAEQLRARLNHLAEGLQPLVAVPAG